MSAYAHGKHLTYGDMKEVAIFNSSNRTKLEQYDTMLGGVWIDYYNICYTLCCVTTCFLENQQTVYG